MERSIRVGVADDDELLRIIISRFLGSVSDLIVVAVVGDGEAAVQLAASGAIDVLILDVEMPGMDGRDALRNIRRLTPDVRVVMYSSLPASKHAATFLQAGAAAYLQKACDLYEIVEVIRKTSPAT